MIPAAPRSRPQPPALYAIADSRALVGRDPAAAAAAMAEAGIRWIQLRAKDLGGAELYRLAERCRRALDGSGAALWIDDRSDVAGLLAVAGVHLGQDDLPPAAARLAIGPERWIGFSTHGEAQLVAADADPDVDVVALGPIFATSGKERPDPPVGLAALARLRRRTGKPLIAIGGLDADNIADVLAAGADSAAVLGAICRGDVRANAALLLAAAGEASEGRERTGDAS